MKRLLLSTLAFALLAAPSWQAPAQAADDAKTLVAVSVSSVDKLLANIDSFGSIAEIKPLTDMVRFQAEDRLDALDTTKACGAVVTTDGVQFTLLGFVPVKDFQKLLRMVPAEDAGDGTYEIESPSPTPLFMKHENGWAFISQSSDGLKNLPADPVKLLVGQEKEYDVCIRANVNNIPADYRNLAIAAINVGAAQMPRVPDETDEQFRARKQAVQTAIRQFVDLIQQSEAVTVGWSLDDSKRNTFLEFSWTALPGSDLAAELGDLKKSTTAFSGFMPSDAAASFNFSAGVSEQDGSQMAGALRIARERAIDEVEKSNDIPDDESRDAAKKVVGDVFDVVIATIEGGKVDGAGSLLLGGKSPEVIFGGRAVDAKKLEDSLKTIVRMAEKDPNFPGTVKLDVETIGGMRIHAIRVPTEKADRQAQELFGDQVEVVVGFSDDSFCVGVGSDCLPTLRKAIDDSQKAGETSTLPMQASLSVGRVIQFAAEVDPDRNPALPFLAEKATAFSGKDRVRMELRPISNGFSYRFELEEGVINLIGQGAQMGARF